LGFRADFILANLVISDLYYENNRFFFKDFLGFLEIRQYPLDLADNILFNFGIFNLALAGKRKIKVLKLLVI
jgi:hypothetical protein